MGKLARGARQASVRGARSGTQIDPKAVDATWRDDARRRTIGKWPCTGALSLGLLISAAVVIQGALGCNGASRGAMQTAGSENPDPEATASCASLSVEKCSVDTAWPSGSRCTVVSGTSYDGAKRCQDGNRAAACRDALADCRTAVVYATDPAGRTWQLPETCTPAGWTVVHPQDGQYVNWPSCDGGDVPPALDCGALTADRCETESRCALIAGTPYDETRNCRGERRVVGCGTAGGGTMITCARDPSGVTWFFGDTRNPKGWTAVSPCPPYPQTACSAP